LNKLIR